MPSIVDCFNGWRTGYLQACNLSEQTSYERGQNYYILAFSHIAHTFLLTEPTELWIQSLPPGTLKTAAKVADVAGCWIGCIAFPVFAMIQHENYPEFAHRWNESRFNHLVVLPEKLTIPTYIKTISTYVLTHAETAFRIAGLVSALGITILINPYYGVGLLSALVYEVIESKGYIPLKVNAFVHKYLGTVSLIGNIIYGSPLLKVYSLYELVCRLSPTIDLPLQYKVDRISRDCWSAIGRLISIKKLEYLIQGIKLREPEATFPNSLASAQLITLEEYEAPFVDNQEHFQKLNYQEILDILEDTSPYQINPSHCSLDFTHKKMLKNADFEKLLTHFDAIDWQNNYIYIRNKLLRDEHFLNLIKGQFSETSIQELTAYTEGATPPNDYPHFEMYIATLAKQLKLTKQQFIAQWVRAQMTIYMEVMKGTRQAKGDPQEVLIAIKHTKKILAYLDTCQDPVIKADFLLKLAIEGGDYCSTALQRTSFEILSSLLYDDPSHDQANKIRYNLQQLRARKVEEMYNFVTVQWPKILSTDVHFFSWISPFLSLGLLPWGKRSRELLSPIGLFSLNIYMPLRACIVQNYIDSMKDSDELTNQNFYNYLENLIINNDSLSAEEKEDLQNKICDEWNETKTGFQRYVLLSLGILRPTES